VGDPAVQLEPAKGKARIMRPGRDPKICDRESESRDGLLEIARHPVRLDWSPTSPPNLRGAPMSAPSSSSAPFSSPETTGRRARSILIGRAREPMSFWDTERRQSSDCDPRSVFGAGLTAWNQSLETKVGDEEGATRSGTTPPRRAGVRGRHCPLTTGGLIGVGRQAQLEEVCAKGRRGTVAIPSSLCEDAAHSLDEEKRVSVHSVVSLSLQL
jgi:hypothetical protein